MTQVLLKSDGQLVWTPNNTLRTQPLVNLSRSNPRWEAYTWLVDLDTPDEVSSILPWVSHTRTSGVCLLEKAELSTITLPDF
jgi:hypothetical protein